VRVCVRVRVRLNCAAIYKRVQFLDEHGEPEARAVSACFSSCVCAPKL